MITSQKAIALKGSVWNIYFIIWLHGRSEACKTLILLNSARQFCLYISRNAMHYYKSIKLGVPSSDVGYLIKVWPEQFPLTLALYYHCPTVCWCHLSWALTQRLQFMTVSPEGVGKWTLKLLLWTKDCTGVESLAGTHFMSVTTTAASSVAASTVHVQWAQQPPVFVRHLIDSNLIDVRGHSTDIPVALAWPVSRRTGLVRHIYTTQ